MRIIAGEAGGRKLKSINTNSVRPTLDRVKEAIFNMISHKLLDSRVLDLFSGFGNLGIEAISRGAAHVDFVEKNKKFAQVINENINICQGKTRAKIFNSNVFTFLDKDFFEKYDLIFMDPPYGFDYINQVMSLIANKDLLAKNGLIITEHHKNDEIKIIKKYAVIKDRNYGDICVKIFKNREE